MRTTWETLDTDKMLDAAEAEATAGLAALTVGEFDNAETLPCYRALDEHAWHYGDCPACQDDNAPDCSEGAELVRAARFAKLMQTQLAAQN